MAPRDSRTEGARDEGLEVGGSEHHGGLEIRPGEVGFERRAELAGGGAGLEVAVQVDAAGEEFALADAGLEDEPELAVGEPVVDGLDDGLELGVGRQDEGAGAA